MEEPPAAEAPGPPQDEEKDEWSPGSAVVEATQAIAGVRAAIRAGTVGGEAVGPGHGQADGSAAAP